MRNGNVLFMKIEIIVNKFKNAVENILGFFLAIGKLGNEYRGDFIAAAIALIAPFLFGFLSHGFYDFTTLSSFFGILFALMFLGLSVNRFYTYLTKRFLKLRFNKPSVKMAILDGYAKGKKNEIPCTEFFYTEFNPDQWYEEFTGNKRFEIEKIPSSKIKEEYLVIINPFGEIYPEEDTSNMLTMKRIKEYIQKGGVFINVAGLAFFYMWNAENGFFDLTGPILETYEIISNQRSAKSILNPVVSPFESSLVNTWLYENFGVRTTLANPKILDVYSVDDEFFTELVDIGDSKIYEYRSALRCESSEAKLIPLLGAKRTYESVEGRFFHCYPFAAVKYGIGYLILAGIKLNKERKDSDFKKTITMIKKVCEKLSKQGTLVKS